jgi:hypothetical protein
MRRYAMLVLCGLLAGCGERSAAPLRAAPSPAGRSVLEGLTGKTAVDAGLRARDQVRTVSSQEQSRVQEVLDEM